MSLGYYVGVPLVVQCAYDRTRVCDSLHDQECLVNPAAGFLTHYQLLLRTDLGTGYLIGNVKLDFKIN